MADQVAHRLRLDRRPAELAERVVERRGEIGRGVGKRAVEVEGDDVEGKGGASPRAMSPAIAMEMASLIVARRAA